MNQTTLFDLVGGEAVVLRLAHAWHQRALADEVVAHAFSHGYHPDHTARLAAYWTEAWGGPRNYTGTFGTETSVVRMHSGNGEHADMDRRAIDCFRLALEDARIEDASVRAALLDYFTWATNERMAAYPRSADDVPHDLTLARWSMKGLER